MKMEKTGILPPPSLKGFRIVLVAVMLILAAESSRARTAQEIDESVFACLDRFYNQIKGGREMVAMAEGVLVMPGIVNADFVIGGEFREGALRVGGKTVSYYNLASGSIGLQIGGEGKDLVILFMTDEVLKQFQSSKGWEFGVDGSVALANFGDSKRVDFIRMNEPIIGFVFDIKGFMADISLKGAKFTKIEPK